MVKKDWLGFGEALAVAVLGSIIVPLTQLMKGDFDKKDNNDENRNNNN